MAERFTATLGERWIAEAKREATRDRRAAKAIELLREGVRTPG